MRLLSYWYLLVLKSCSRRGEWMICLLCRDVATVVTKHMHTVVIAERINDWQINVQQVRRYS